MEVEGGTVDLWQRHPHIVLFVPRFSFTWSRAVIKNAGKKGKMIKTERQRGRERQRQRQRVRARERQGKK